jgi:hypothetical protein
VKGPVQWGAVGVVAVAGLGLLTKYEYDKSRSEMFTPPTRPAPVFLPPTPRSETPTKAAPAALPGDGPAYRRIQAMTSCAALQSARDDASRRAERLSGERRASEARGWQLSVIWAEDRMGELHCGR